MVDEIQNLKRSSVVNVIFSIQFIAKMLYLVFSLQKKMVEKPCKFLVLHCYNEADKVVKD